MDVRDQTEITTSSIRVSACLKSNAIKKHFNLVSKAHNFSKPVFEIVESCLISSMITLWKDRSFKLYFHNQLAEDEIVVP